MIITSTIVLFLISVYIVTKIVKTNINTKKSRIWLSLLLIPIFTLPLYFLYHLMPAKEGAVPATIYAIFYLSLILYMASIRPKN